MDQPRPAEPELVHSAAPASDPPGLAGTRAGLGRHLYLWRKAWLVRRALRQADEPSLVLDLSHETGSFWPLLAEHGSRVILAAAASPERLDSVLATQSAEVAARVKVFPGSAAAIQLHDNAVDCIFAMGLLPRVGESAQRLAILRELRRVTRDTLIVSLQLEGNYEVWREGRGGIKRATIEEELGRIGFDIVGRYGLLPGYSALWIYVLRKDG